MFRLMIVGRGAFLVRRVGFYDVTGRLQSIFWPMVVGVGVVVGAGVFVGSALAMGDKRLDFVGLMGDNRLDFMALMGDRPIPASLVPQQHGSVIGHCSLSRRLYDHRGG